MALKVLIITERFYPEEFIINDLAAEWAARGFSVTVLTQAPSYPFARIFPGYSNRLFFRETWKGINIFRFFTVTGYRDSLFLKILNYFSFALVSSVIALFIGRRYDRVFVYQTGPLTQAFPAVLIRKLYGTPFTMWVQDVWPDMVYAYGFKKTRLMKAFLDAISGFIYRNTDNISVSCAGFAKSIESYVPGRIIPHFPNWPTVIPEAGGGEIKLSDKFNFTFAGNVGKFQNLENVIRGFGLASAENDDIRLNIIGDGSDLERLKDMVSRDGIRGVVFWGRKKQFEMPGYFRASAVMVISLCDQPALVLTVPAKFQAYLAFSKPIFCVLNGEVKRIVEEFNTGICAQPDSLEDIKAGFLKFYSLKGSGLDAFSRNSLSLLEKVYNRGTIIEGITALVTPDLSIKGQNVTGKNKIAVVCDWLVTYAGAERILEQVLEVLPEADLFSLIDFLPSGERGFIKNKKVRTSFLQHFPFARSGYRSFLPLMSYAVERLDVSGYDLVISISHAVAKGVKTRPGQKHICICCSPMRYAWDLRGQYLEESGLNSGIKGWLANRLLDRVKAWDLKATPRVTDFIAISGYIGRSIEHNYGRGSVIIYPPVYVDKFVPGGRKGDFYLTVSRMVPYKRVPLIVEAFASMPDKRLVVIGDGPEFEKVKAKAAGNIEVLGYQPDDVLKDYMQRAKAFVFAAEEDFGIAPVEAQACGTPVIAYGQGAVRETVVEGKTGLFFNEQSVQSIIGVVKRFESMEGAFDPAAIRKNAEIFSTGRFKEEFADFTAKVRALPLRNL